MSIDFHRREYGAFLSHSEKDGDYARSLGSWLDRYAGLKVWDDEKDTAGRRMVTGDLQAAIGKSRSYVLVVTPNSVGADWVKKECEKVNEEAARERLFRKLLLVSSDVEKEIPEQLQSSLRIDVPADAPLSDVVATKLLSNLYVSDQGPGQYDVYVTRGWSDDEKVSEFTDRACAEIAKKFRLIGDSPRDDPYDRDRIRSIITSCGAYVAFLPPREPARLGYILPEISIARSCNLPALVFADNTVLSHPPDSLRTFDGETVALDGAIPVDMKGVGLNDETEMLLRRETGYLKEQYRKPNNPYTVFFTSDSDRISDRARKGINRIVSSITGRDCVFPDEIVGERIEERLTAAICTSVAVIADITSASAETWYHAGIARGASRPLELLTLESASLPRSFDNMKPFRYKSELERMGLVHKIVYHHRRRFMNLEVTR